MSSDPKNPPPTMPLRQGAEIVLVRPSDQSIRSYLCLPSPQEVALLAVAIAPKFDSHEPEALANEAINLRLAAEKMLAIRRVELLSGMPSGDVAYLKAHYGIPESFANEESRFSMAIDPVRGPLITWIPWVATLESPHLSPEQKLSFLQSIVRESIQEATDNKNVPVPEYPYRMENALPFVANVEGVRFETLSRAFKDHILHSPKNLYNISKKIRRLKSEINTLDKTIDDCLPDSKELSDLRTTRENLAKKLISEEKRAKVIDSHVLGQPIPNSLSKQLDSMFQSHFTADESSNCKAMLKLLVSGFREFFDSTKSTYLLINEDQNKKEEHTREKSRDGGKNGVALRETKKWELCFSKFLESDELKKFVRAPSIGQPTALIQQFSANYHKSKATSKPSIANIQSLFVLVFNASQKDKPVDYVRQGLPKV